MKNNYLLAVTTFIAGVLLTLLISGYNRQQVQPANMMGGGGMMTMNSSMNEMMRSLEEAEGEDFDMAFMNSMMVHHEGAIEMAKEAKTKGMHGEIRNLADDIIEAQTNEIEQMKMWQKEWEANP